MSSTQFKIERRNHRRDKKIWKKRNFKLEKADERVYFMKQSGFRKVLRWIPFHRTASPEDQVKKRRERRGMILAANPCSTTVFQLSGLGKGETAACFAILWKKGERTWKSERRLSADVSSARSLKETELSVSSARAIRATSSARVNSSGKVSSIFKR